MKRIKEREGNTLWTKDFTILTLGSVVSMLGSNLSGYALSLLVLDYTGSPMLYAIYIAVFTLPQIVMPIFSGAILDRFSRSRTIYTLDFISSGFYLLLALVCGRWMSFPVLAAACFILGAINSVYMVAFQSFYPMLITPGNYSKAYSVASLLENISFLMMPVSAFAYNTIGIVPLLIIDAASYFIAAAMETKISAREEYIELQKQADDGSRSSGKRLLDDIREGFQYLFTERGLLAVAVFFGFTSLSMGASSAVTLPFFEANFSKGEYIFILVQGTTILGRGIGGIVHYRKKLPVDKKFAIALAVYISITLINGVYLYTPVPVMLALNLTYGLLGVTSYTIRISATQSYVPDEKKGRFNGAFNMISTVGSFAGTLIAGAMTTVMPPRSALVVFFAVECVMAILVIGGNKKYIAPIYNRQQ